MQIDIDNYVTDGKDLPENIPFKKGEDVGVIRMYGVTEDGYSVMAHVFNFMSYFYVEIINHEIGESITEDDLEKFQEQLNVFLSPGATSCNCVCKIEHH